MMTIGVLLLCLLFFVTLAVICSIRISIKQRTMSSEDAVKGWDGTLFLWSCALGTFCALAAVTTLLLSRHGV